MGDKTQVSERDLLECLFDLYGYDTVSGSGLLNAIVIKNSPGQIFGWYIFNNNATVVYCNFFNQKSDTIVPGTTIPFMSFGIPGGLGANVPPSPRGINFNKSIAVNFSTLRGGNVAPALSVDFNFWFDLRNRRC
jgi:hypothetical protein